MLEALEVWVEQDEEGVIDFPNGDHIKYEIYLIPGAIFMTNSWILSESSCKIRTVVY